MRFLLFAPTTTLCLCRGCARKHLSSTQVSITEHQGYAWDLDQGRLIVLERTTEQPCMACEQPVPQPDETVEYLCLHVYRLITFLKAAHDLTRYGGMKVAEVLNLIGVRFPHETAAIRAEIERLVEG